MKERSDQPALNSLTLYELNAMAARALVESLPGEYWVQAEISELRVHPLGHCYLEFVQKNAEGNGLKAKAGGVVWRNKWPAVQRKFEQSTGRTLSAGIKVQVRVKVDLHEQYGYKLIVNDIDPTYSLGDLQERRLKILRQLEQEGVLELNKQLCLPALPQHIAVVSAAGAAGYEDFCTHLRENPYGFGFSVELFASAMQGERVAGELTEALGRISDRCDEFDVVVIIRGGGATSDLSGFDAYLPAAAVAQFPLPVFTGIGHERDNTVLDAVAHTRVKTPTAAAEKLIQHIAETAWKLQNLHECLRKAVDTLLAEEHKSLGYLKRQLSNACRLRLHNERQRLRLMSMKMAANSRRQHEQACHRLQLLSERVKASDPRNILQRGYSITLKNGLPILRADALTPGDEIETLLHSGRLQAIVKNTIITETEKKA